EAVIDAGEAPQRLVAGQPGLGRAAVEILDHHPQLVHRAAEPLHILLGIFWELAEADAQRHATQDPERPAHAVLLVASAGRAAALPQRRALPRRSLAGRYRTASGRHAVRVLVEAVVDQRGDG